MSAIDHPRVQVPEHADEVVPLSSGDHEYSSASLHPGPRPVPVTRVEDESEPWSRPIETMVDRLADIKAHRIEWADDGDEPVSQVALEHGARIVEGLKPIEAGIGIFPTPDAGLRFQVTTIDKELRSVTITADGMMTACSATERGLSEWHSSADRDVIGFLFRGWEGRRL